MRASHVVVKALVNTRFVSVTVTVEDTEVTNAESFDVLVTVMTVPALLEVEIIETVLFVV